MYNQSQALIYIQFGSKGHKNSNWVIFIFLFIRNNSSIAISVFSLLKLVLPIRAIPLKVTFLMLMKTLQGYIFGLDIHFSFIFQPSLFLCSSSCCQSLTIYCFRFLWTLFKLKVSLTTCIVKDCSLYNKMFIGWW